MSGTASRFVIQELVCPSRFCPIYSSPYAEPEYGTVEGSGLGLSITKGLIELMGGELLVESRDGQELP